jgi:hypothetical protein
MIKTTTSRSASKDAAHTDVKTTSWSPLTSIDLLHISKKEMQSMSTGDEVDGANDSTQVESQGLELRLDKL